MILTLAIGVAASVSTLTILHVMSGDPAPGRSNRLLVPLLDNGPARGHTPGANPDDNQMSYRDAANLLAGKQGKHRTAIFGTAAPSKAHDPICRWKPSRAWPLPANTSPCSSRLSCTVPPGVRPRIRQRQSRGAEQFFAFGATSAPRLCVALSSVSLQAAPCRKGGSNMGKYSPGNGQALDGFHRQIGSCAFEGAAVPKIAGPMLALLAGQ